MSAVIYVKSKNRHLIVSRVNLKLKFQKGNHLAEVYDVSRLQDENLRETLEELLNTKLENEEELKGDKLNILRIC